MTLESDTIELVVNLDSVAMVNMGKQKLSAIREDITEKCAAILLGYRTKCAAASRASQVRPPIIVKPTC